MVKWWRQWWQLKWHSLNVLGLFGSGHRLAAIRTFGQLGDKRATPVLLRALGNSDPGVRLASVEALAELRDASAVEPLCRMLGDGEGDVFQVAVCALGCLGDPRAAGPLITALDALLASPRADAKAQSARSPAADDAIALRARSAELVAAALAELGVRDAVAPLCRMLGDPGNGTDGRVCAAWALGKLGDPGAIDALCRALRDNTTDVRLAAAEALENLGSTRAVDPLLEALRDTWSERATAETEYRKSHIALNVNDDVSWSKLREAIKTALEKLGDTQWREVCRQAYAAQGDHVPQIALCLFDAKRIEEKAVPSHGAYAEARFLEALQKALATSGGWAAVPSLAGCRGNLPRGDAPGQPSGAVVLGRWVAGMAVDAHLPSGFRAQLEADPANLGLVPYAIGVCPISASLARKVHGTLMTSEAPGYIGSVTLNADFPPRGLKPLLAAAREAGLHGSDAAFAAVTSALGVPVKMGIKEGGRCFGWLVPESELSKLGLAPFRP